MTMIGGREPIGFRPPSRSRILSGRHCCAHRTTASTCARAISLRRSWSASCAVGCFRFTWGGSGCSRRRGSTPRRADASAGVRADELRAALRAHRSALVGIAIASGLVSLLSLTAPLFMLQVYDRVLPSRSVPTLVGLALLVLVLFAFQGLLDMLRGRVLLRVGRGIDERLSPRVFELVMRDAAARPRRRAKVSSRSATWTMCDRSCRARA